MTASAEATYRPIIADDVHTNQYFLKETAVILVLYGAQITISLAAVTVLARRQGRSYITLAAILGLLCTSTIAGASQMIFYFLQFPLLGPSARDIDVLLYHLDVLITVARFSSYVLSDVVLVWRAWCLWPNNRVAKGLLTLSISGSIGGTIASCVVFFKPGLPALVELESNRLMLIRLVPLLVTNAVATALIGAKMLHYRRNIKGSLSLFTHRTQAETVLMLLLESGLTYILFWVLVYILHAVAISDPFSDAVIFTSISCHIAGIYPACVLFVAIQGQTESLLSVTPTPLSQAIHFTDSPEICEGQQADTFDSQPRRSDGTYAGSALVLNADSLQRLPREEAPPGSNFEGCPQG